MDSNCVVNVTGNYGNIWLQRNEQTNYTTGNLTVYNIAVGAPAPLENGTNIWGDNVYNITQYDGTYSGLSSEYQQVVYEAGIPPSERSYRMVSANPAPPS